MSFDGLFFRRTTQLLSEVMQNGKIVRIFALSEHDLVFAFFNDFSVKQALFSVASNQSYFTLTEYQYDPIAPTHFVQILRKHLEEGKITAVEQIGLDRILKITVAKYNDIHDLIVKFVYLEFTGRVTNMILTKDDNTILDCMIKNGYKETTDRILMPGATYRLPPQKEFKDPLVGTIQRDLSLSAQFHGISRLLETEIEFRMQKGEDFRTIIRTILESKTIYIHEEGKAEYHYLPLTHLGSEATPYPWEQGIFQYHEIRMNQKLQHEMAKDLLKIVKREIERNLKKRVRLNEELQSAKQSDQYRRLGDLIFTYGGSGEQKLSSITVFDEERKEDVTIPLEERFSLSANANRYFVKYQKSKKAVPLIEEQLRFTHDELQYFESLELQLQEADRLSIEQIREELVQQHYLSLSPSTSRPKHKKNEKKRYPPLQFTCDGALISVGRNNLQNDFLTFQLAKYNEWFFHVKDYPGSHVVLHHPSPSETQIRFAANLAAYYSKARFSSSVPVDYLLVKDVKKPSGAKPGKVFIKANKTIYIDPRSPEKDY